MLVPERPSQRYLFQLQALYFVANGRVLAAHVNQPHRHYRQNDYRNCGSHILAYNCPGIFNSTPTASISGLDSLSRLAWYNL